MKNRIHFIYGTAWKEDLTARCVYDALDVGYRAIDTANQRQHYYEEGVGEGLTKAISELSIRREDLFLQTKFTYARGQDHRKPYDEKASYPDQVKQSFESSLKHLRTDYLDSYILHGPLTSNGLAGADWEVWHAMEEIVRSGQIKHLGISNVDLEQVTALYKEAEIKPNFVQNRCYAGIHWDKSIRGFCSEKNISYQGFSLLTASWKFLGGTVLRPEDRNIPHLVFTEKNLNEGDHSQLDSALEKIVEETGQDIQQIIFRFAQQVGIIPITGTRSKEHMKMNLEKLNFDLTNEQLKTIENIAL